MLYRAAHQLVADEAVAAVVGRIDGQQKGELILVHFITAQDAGELADDPGLILRQGLTPDDVLRLSAWTAAGSCW